MAMIAALAACAANTPPVPAQGATSALAVAPIAGQRVPVLPASFLVAEAPADEWLPSDRAVRLRWVDSIIGETLMDRAPEVVWVLPPELRRLARRAPGTVTDPDRMGQAVLRADKLDRVPDPLRAYLRSLAAVSDSRAVMVPASVVFTPDSTGTAIRGELVLVLTDSRNGGILWRSKAHAVAASPAAAIRAALAIVLPDIN